MLILFCCFFATKGTILFQGEGNTKHTKQSKHSCWSINMQTHFQTSYEQTKGKPNVVVIHTLTHPSGQLRTEAPQLIKFAKNLLSFSWSLLNTHESLVECDPNAIKVSCRR